VLTSGKRAALDDLGEAGKTQRGNLGRVPVLEADGTAVAGLENAIEQENREHRNNGSDDDEWRHLRGGIKPLSVSIEPSSRDNRVASWGGLSRPLP